MKHEVVILGPNLRDQSNGDFHVHASGCSHLRRPEYRGINAYPVTIQERVGVAEFIYDDHLGDNGIQEGTPEAKAFYEESLGGFCFLGCAEAMFDRAERKAKAEQEAAEDETWQRR